MIIVVVDQIVDGDPSCGVPIQSCESDPEQGLCKYADQVDVMEIDAQLAIGPVFARHLGHRLYRGEYYAMQIDAHVTFVKDWDTDIIDQMEATGNEMAVMSFYLTDIEGSLDPKTGKSLRHTVPIMVGNFIFFIEPNIVSSSLILCYMLISAILIMRVVKENICDMAHNLNNTLLSEICPKCSHTGQQVGPFLEDISLQIFRMISINR